MGRVFPLSRNGGCRYGWPIREGRTSEHGIVEVQSTTEVLEYFLMTRRNDFSKRKNGNDNQITLNCRFSIKKLRGRKASQRSLFRSR